MFIKVIIEFEKDINQRLVFEELNLVLLENFKNWLLNEKEYSINYSNGIIKGLKTISKGEAVFSSFIDFSKSSGRILIYVL